MREGSHDNGFKSEKFRISKEIQKHCMETIVDEWNKLPNKVIKANTLGSFKYKFYENINNVGCKQTLPRLGQEAFCSFHLF